MYLYNFREWDIRVFIMRLLVVNRFIYVCNFFIKSLMLILYLKIVFLFMKK